MLNGQLIKWTVAGVLPFFALACSSQPRTASVKFRMTVSARDSKAMYTASKIWQTKLERIFLGPKDGYGSKLIASPIAIPIPDYGTLDIKPVSYLSGLDGPTSIPKLFYNDVSPKNRNPAVVLLAIAGKRGLSRELKCDYGNPPDGPRNRDETVVAFICPAVSFRKNDGSELDYSEAVKDPVASEIIDSIRVNVTVIGP